MTSLGDLCSCGDLALPGQDLCGGCFSDHVTRRAEVEREAAERTEQHEAQVEAQEAAA